MKKLVSIGVRSVFKISLVLGSVAGLMIGLVLMITDFVDHLYMEGLVTLVLAPILYGVLGAAVNALMAGVYNYVAARLGGIDIELGD